MAPPESRFRFSASCPVEDPMICETCRWSGRPGFVPARHGRPTPDRPAGPPPMLVPCPDCGGQGIAHCCDGICAQPQDPQPQDLQPRGGA
jgi:hypothetical protein